MYTEKIEAAGQEAEDKSKDEPWRKQSRLCQVPSFEDHARVQAKMDHALI